MKQFFYTLSAFLLITACAIQPAKAQFQYINPLPGSKYHNPETGIILRNGNQVQEASLHHPGLFKITGDINGDYSYDVKLVEDRKTIIITPRIKFAEGENVTIVVGEGLVTTYGLPIHGASFSFNIHAPRSEAVKKEIADELRNIYDEELKSGNHQKGIPENDFAFQPSLLDGLPAITILKDSFPSEGQIFGDDFNLFQPDNCHYWIIQNNGDSVFGRFDTVSFNNFDLNNNGYMTVYNKHDSSYIMIDSSFNKVGAFFMGNGYYADVHEFRIYPDKKRYMISYAPQIIDMTVYNPNYDTAAIVNGLVLQEIDSDNNVIFEWSSWDHFGLFDANHINFQTHNIDAVHCNSVERDFDGNILISSRHLSEVTKINRTTGDIMWRMGGNENEFTFINDADKISWQHDVRRLPNGNITLFDNGNYHIPHRSYAKEYQVDEVNKIATLVFSYTRKYNNQYVISNAMGATQRLPNGNTFIGWGMVEGTGFPSMTEVDPAGNVVWEMKFNNSALTCYRARKYLWEPCNVIDPSSFITDSITTNSAQLTWDNNSKVSEFILQYKKCSAANWIDVLSAISPYHLTGLQTDSCYNWRVISICNVYGDTIYSATQTFITDFATTSILSYEKFDFDIYPNPATKMLIVNFNAAFSAEIEMTITNFIGVNVMQEKFLAHEGSNHIEVTLPSLTPGIYSLQLNSATGILSKKLVLK